MHLQSSSLQVEKNPEYYAANVPTEEVFRKRRKAQEAAAGRKGSGKGSRGDTPMPVPAPDVGCCCRWWEWETHQLSKRDDC